MKGAKHLVAFFVCNNPEMFARVEKIKEVMKNV